MRTESKDGTVSDQAFSFEKVTITAPSPTKDMPTPDLPVNITDGAPNEGELGE